MNDSKRVHTIKDLQADESRVMSQHLKANKRAKRIESTHREETQ
jgi:hypothetical protein